MKVTLYATALLGCAKSHSHYPRQWVCKLAASSRWPGAILISSYSVSNLAPSPRWPGITAAIAAVIPGHLGLGARLDTEYDDINIAPGHLELAASLHTHCLG